MNRFKYILILFLLLFKTMTTSANDSDVIIKHIREKLLIEFREIPESDVKVKLLKRDDQVFHAYFEEKPIFHQYFKSKRDSLIKDYGRMVARIAIGRYSCADSTLRDSVLRGLVAYDYIDFEELMREGRTEGVHTPAFALIILQEEIIVIRIRCEDTHWYFEWKDYVGFFLKGILPISTGKVYIGYCGGPVEIVTEDYFTKEK